MKITHEGNKMNFKGLVNSYKSTENEISAQKFDGIAWTEFEKTKNTPSSIKIEARCDKGGVNISMQRAKSVKEPVTLVNFVGVLCTTINLDEYKNGKYKIIATGKDAENISIKYEFV